MTVKNGFPMIQGSFVTEEGICFSYASCSDDCGVILFTKDATEEVARVPFPSAQKVGNVHHMCLCDVDPLEITYCFYEGDKKVTDEYGKAFVVSHAYGECPAETFYAAKTVLPEFDWEDDVNPGISYEDSLVYCMHVRGFTMHKSAKVKAKGTYRGIIEKIPYLKELGVTTIELQPAYEFFSAEAKEESLYGEKEVSKAKINYWGYKKGLYYSPKQHYSYSNDPSVEFKELVKALHQNQMEVVMQFFFTGETSPMDVLPILRYWIMEYHVDGFHLMGDSILADVLSKEPVLAKTKLWYFGFSESGREDNIYVRKSGERRYLAEYNDEFRYSLRRFLKGDDDSLSSAARCMRRNPYPLGVINYLSNYDGFTMMDMVSYERKHNESNGEDNKDGTDYNLTWNCGQEGPTRKKTVLSLRMKQFKNAMMLLFLSQGTPLIFMGDEFGNSQKGNNNPYCLDDETTWLNWKDLETNRDLHEFVKALICLRMNHPVFRQERELRLMDYGACGYPDASYHGEMPWKADMASYSRHFAVMYCGKYAHKEKNTPDDFYYVAYNLHWEEHAFSLPKLPADTSWEICLTTDEGVTFDVETESQNMLTLPPRSICVCAGKLKDKAPVRRKKGK